MGLQEATFDTASIAMSFEYAATLSRISKPHQQAQSNTQPPHRDSELPTMVCCNTTQAVEMPRPPPSP